MRLYFAGIYTGGLSPDAPLYQKLSPQGRKDRDSCGHILESYAYLKDQRVIDALTKYGEKIFLDSGAFTVWQTGGTVDFNAYCNFILANPQIIERCCVADVVHDPLATFQNQHEMEARGIAAIPCYHQGEDERYLAYYAERYDYVAIGGLVGLRTDYLIELLDHLWSVYLTKPDGSPRIKVHAFGITSRRVMERYPWYSIDSTSWVKQAGFGMVMHPDHGLINLSTRSAMRKMIDKHLFTITPIEQQKIIADIDARGYTYEELCQVRASRSTFNIQTYRDIAARYVTSRFINPQISLFV